MEVFMRKVSEITPYAKNTKIHNETQIDNVAESIKKYGWAQPIAVDKDDVVIIGHCRLLAAKKLGLQEVPCVSMDDLTPAQVKALRIVDNKSNESEWDMGFLKDELDGLDLDGFDFDFGLDEIGEFDENALEDMFTDAEEKPKEPKRVQCPHCGEWFEV